VYEIRQTSIRCERYVVDGRPGQRTGDGKLHPIIQPRRPRPASDRVPHPDRLALVDRLVVDGIDAADDPLDARWFARLVEVGLVDPVAQRAFAYVLVDVAPEALADTHPLRTTHSTVLLKYRNTDMKT